MAEQQRITPEMVLAAYEKSGATPKRYSFLTTIQTLKGPVTCACGIGALYEAHADKLGGCLNTTDDEPAISYGGAVYGEAYTLGFTQGFDGVTDIDWSFCESIQGPSAYARHVQGYEDGKAAWEAVKDFAWSGRG